jgi:anti-anti-sigma factor
MGRNRHFKLNVSSNNHTLFVRITGHLDGSTACELEQALQDRQDASTADELNVDLSGVHRFDYFGIAVFAKVMRGQRNRFNHISFTGLQPSTENVFRRLGLENNGTEFGLYARAGN